MTHAHTQIEDTSRTEDRVKGPVCGMTVDPHTTPHHADHAGHESHFCSAGCRSKFVSDPGRYLGKEQQPASPEGAIWTCPPAGSSGCLPDLRHGARTCDRHGGQRTQSRNRRHDAALLDRTRVVVPGAAARKWAATFFLHFIMSCPWRFRSASRWHWPRRWCSGRAGPFSCGAGHRCERATSTCSR